MTQGRIWHVLQPYWSMLTILVPCSFTPLLWPLCTQLILVSILGVFIRPQWTVRYPHSFYIFTLHVDLACPLGKVVIHRSSDPTFKILSDTLSYQHTVLPTYLSARHVRPTPPECLPLYHPVDPDPGYRIITKEYTACFQILDSSWSCPVLSCNVPFLWIESFVVSFS